MSNRRVTVEFFEPDEESSGARQGGQASSRQSQNSATLEYGLEEPVVVNLTPGLTIEQAYEQHAEDFGIDPEESALTYRVQNRVVPGNTALTAGMLVTAEGSREDKG